MKILFVTDLHGDQAKYQKVFEFAKKHNVQVVVNGGDMLSMEDDLHRTQREFILGFLDHYFAEFDKAGIYHLGILGNDDLGIHDEYFEQTCSKFNHIVNLAQRKFSLDGYEFLGFNLVADYPFRLKDRCRMDLRNSPFQRQMGQELLSTEQGFQTLKDWFGVAMSKPTLEDELETLPKPDDMEKTVYVIHMPPAFVSLDVCWSCEKVGSEAIYKFIDKNQPLLTLHGHIHESPARTGVWQARIGNTVSVQPGQLKEGVVSCVLIDLDQLKMEKLEYPLSMEGIVT